jgi:hypothetical protein
MGTDKPEVGTDKPLLLLLLLLLLTVLVLVYDNDKGGDVTPKADLCSFVLH